MVNVIVVCLDCVPREGAAWHLWRRGQQQDMAEAAACDFDDWLRGTLVALDTDDEVFSPYIKGILEGEENPDEKLDALQGILSEITVSGGRDRRVAGLATLCWCWWAKARQSCSVRGAV